MRYGASAIGVILQLLVRPNWLNRPAASCTVTPRTITKWPARKLAEFLE